LSTHRPKEYPVITNGDLSGNLTSIHTDVEFKDRALYQVDFTDGGSLDGTLLVEYSNDETSVPESLWTWKELDFGSPILISGAVTGLSHQILITQITFKRTRLVFNSVAGAGTMNAWIKTASEGK
jgi:hypothetical protein